MNTQPVQIGQVAPRQPARNEQVVRPSLTAVYCKNGFCREVNRRGSRQLVGEVLAPGLARLRCPACKEIATYIVRSETSC